MTVSEIYAQTDLVISQNDASFKNDYCAKEPSTISLRQYMSKSCSTEYGESEVAIDIAAAWIVAENRVRFLARSALVTFQACAQTARRIVVDPLHALIIGICKVKGLTPIDYKDRCGCAKQKLIVGFPFISMRGQGDKKK